MFCVAPIYILYLCDYIYIKLALYTLNFEKFIIGKGLLTFTTRRANSTDNKVEQTDDIFLNFPRKQVLTFHANWDNLHEIKPVFWEK